jgi:hypothetical protein
MKNFIICLFTFISLSISALSNTPIDSMFVQAEDSAKVIDHKPRIFQEGYNYNTIILGGLAVNLASITYLEYKWWWEGNYHPFIYENDGFYNNYSLGIDKIGHFYTSYMYFHVVDNLLSLGTFSDRTRLAISTSLPVIYALSIELGDGWSTYAFSGYDLGFNLAGIGVGFLQTRYPALQAVKVKWSFYPSQNNFWTGHDHFSPTNDYDGQIYWLSFNVNKLLPRNAKKYWPKYLNLATGYGVEGISNVTNTTAYRQYFFGIDYNLSAIPAKRKISRALINTLDLFKYPAPGFSNDKDGFRFRPVILR